MRSQRFAAKCATCQRDRAPNETFSYRGKCPSCSLGRMLHQFEHGGERFNDPEYVEAWRNGMAGSVGAVIPPKVQRD